MTQLIATAYVQGPQNVDKNMWDVKYLSDKTQNQVTNSRASCLTAVSFSLTDTLSEAAGPIVAALMASISNITVTSMIATQASVVASPVNQRLVLNHFFTLELYEF